MNEEDYQEIAGILQEKFKEYGLNEIADLRNYKLGDRESKDGREISARKLVYLMLKALDRVLIVEDHSVVESALYSIGELVKVGDAPTKAMIHYDDGLESRVTGRQEPAEITGINTFPIRLNLYKLARQLEFSDWEPPKEGGVNDGHG